MAGTLTISTLSDGTNSTSSTNCIQGSAKAWVRFNGVPATPTINAQYNVSSITKNATGDYTVNFTNAISDANYSVVVSATRQTSTAPDYNYRPTLAGTNFILAASVRVVMCETTGVGNPNTDAYAYCVDVFR